MRARTRAGGGTPPPPPCAGDRRLAAGAGRATLPVDALACAHCLTASPSSTARPRADFLRVSSMSCVCSRVRAGCGLWSEQKLGARLERRAANELELRRSADVRARLRAPLPDGLLEAATRGRARLAREIPNLVAAAQRRRGPAADASEQLGSLEYAAGRGTRRAVVNDLLRLDPAANSEWQQLQEPLGITIGDYRSPEQTEPRGPAASASGHPRRRDARLRRLGPAARPARAASSWTTCGRSISRSKPGRGARSQCRAARPRGTSRATWAARVVVHTFRCTDSVPSSGPRPPRCASGLDERHAAERARSPRGGGGGRDHADRLRRRGQGRQYVQRRVCTRHDELGVAPPGRRRRRAPAAGRARRRCRAEAA